MRVVPDCHVKWFLVRGRARSGTEEAEILTSEGPIGPKHADKAAKPPC